MDLNHIFLFIALISPLLVLIRAWRPGGVYRTWRIASVIVLVATGLSWIFFRHIAGFIGAATWFLLLFIPAVGQRKVVDLAAQQRYQAARRLAETLQIFHPSAELREQVRVLRSFESNPDPEIGGPFFARRSNAAVSGQMDRQRRFRRTPAVVVFIVLNIAVFLIEISVGNWNDYITLHRLGALEPWRVVMLKEYWRLFTALFLHAGVIHLSFNLFALYVLGPGLERAIGSFRFTTCYLVSGIGSSVGVVALWMMRLTSATQVVGASGSIMGIVGAWAGFLIQHRHIPRARERLRNILLIIVIQTIFDLTTPQVSTAAHICGLLTGLITGLALTGRETGAP